MNANESRDNKRPTETVEHDRRELGIEEREVGLRTHPGVRVDGDWVRAAGAEGGSICIDLGAPRQSVDGV